MWYHWILPDRKFVLRIRTEEALLLLQELLLSFQALLILLVDSSPWRKFVAHLMWYSEHNAGPSACLLISYTRAFAAVTRAVKAHLVLSSTRALAIVARAVAIDARVIVTATRFLAAGKFVAHLKWYLRSNSSISSVLD